MMRILYALLFIATCLSCSSLEKQVRDGPVSGRNDLSYDQAVREVDLVRDVFCEVAPWRYSTPERYEQGMAYLESLKSQFRSHSRIQSSELCEELAHFFTIVPDNHSYFVFQSRECGPNPNRPEYQGNVGFNTVKGKDRPWSWETVKIGKKNGLLLSILRFPSFKNEVWNDLKHQLKEKLSLSNFLIIDLRGSRGGDNDPALYIAALLWGGKIPSREKRYQLSSPLAFTLRANDEKFNGNKDNYQMFMEMAEQGNSGSSFLIIKSEFEVSPESFSKTPKPEVYSKPIFILSDRENGSAGEEMIMALRHHPFVKIIGENSKGFFHFGNAGLFQLPYSGIQVHSSTYYNKIEGNEFFEKIGFPPDVRVQEDALLWLKKNSENIDGKR